VQRPSQRFTHVVKAINGQNFGDVLQSVKAPLAALCAAALLTGAIVPEEALAARSGGRVGGSSFSARRSAPSAPRAGPSSGPTIRNYNYYAPPPVVAPPLIGGFGFPGFGFGGYGGVAVGPAVVVPGFGFISSLFSLFFLIITLSFILNVIRGIMNNKNDRYDD